MGKEFKIATLITCHNRGEKTLSCLKYLFEANLPDSYKIEVYLVDDGSTDGTGELVKLNYPDVNVLKGNGELYWNRGMYFAWETAFKKFDYDFYFWLNDDTLIFKNALHNALTESENMNCKSIIAGATCNQTKIITTYGGWLDGKLITVNGNTQYCDYFNGNFVLVPKSVFKKLGNLDYFYRHTSGDFDYGYRAKKSGIKSVVVGEYVGTCERDKKTLKCFDPDVPFFKRVKLFYTPTGKNPFEYFHFNKKYKGVIKAVGIFFTNHFRVFFPTFFVK